MPRSSRESSVSTMSEGPCLDTDIVLKCAAWNLEGELLGILSANGKPATLGLVHLIAAKQMSRLRLNDREAGGRNLDILLSQLECLEPDQQEAELAAEIVEVAQVRNLPIDPGEAQLFAIASNRCIPLLLTGDKRAIRAMSEINEDQGLALKDRLVCLEQAIRAIAAATQPLTVRDKICAEPEVDGAMRLVCSCGHQDWDPGQLDEGLESFIAEIRRGAGPLLHGGSLLA